MDVPSENSSFFMCTLCAKVFMTKDEAAKHVCPKVAVVAKEQGKNPKKGAIRSHSAHQQNVAVNPQTTSMLKESGKKIGVNSAFPKSIDDTLESNSGWTIEATNTLIDLYKDMKEERGRVVWSEIAAAMKKLGHKVSGYQCEVRFSIIKNRYHRIAECLAKGKASSKMTAFPYLQALSEVIPVKKHNVKRDVNWTDENETEFLTILDAKMFEQSSIDEKEELSMIWADVSQQLKSKEIDIPPTKLELHWVGLVKEYKRIIIENELSENDKSNSKNVEESQKTPIYIDNAEKGSKDGSAECVERGSGDREQQKSEDGEKQGFEGGEKLKSSRDGEVVSGTDAEKLGAGDASQGRTEKNDSEEKVDEQVGDAAGEKIHDTTKSAEETEKPTMKNFNLIKDIIQFFPEEYIENVENLEDQLLDELEDDGGVGCMWKPSDTKALLALIKDRKKYFTSFLYTKKSIWKDIAKSLTDKGHEFTATQAEGKWKSLKAKYRKALKDKEDGVKNVHIPFYDEITEVHSFLADGKEQERNSSQGSVADNDDQDPDESENLNDDYEAYKPVCISIWHKVAIKDLLDLMKERKSYLANTAFSKKSIWKDIAKNLKLKGYNFNAQQAEGKWKSLKTKYRRLLRQKSSKRELDSLDMPYVEVFREIYDYLETEHPDEIPATEAGSLIRMKGMDYADDDEDDGDSDTVASRYERAPAPWSTSATKILLQLMMDRKLCFAESKILRTFFEDISSIMNKKGYDYDGVQCQSKWKTMRRSYKKVMDHNSLPNSEQKRIPFQDTIKFLFDIREEAEQDAKARKSKPKKRKPGRYYDSDSDESEYEQEIVYDAEGCPVLWNADMTNTLLNNYKDVYLKVKKGLYNGKMFWKIVHNRMRRHGYKISVGNCKDRFQGLRDTYQRKTHRVSRGLPVSWQYYNDVQSVLNLKTKLGKKPLEASTPVCKTLPLDETLNRSKDNGSVIWDDNATAALIAAYEKRKEKFTNAMEYKRKDLWEEVSKELQEMNFNYSPVNCNSKFKTLLRAYRNVLKNHNVKRRKKLCPFYDELTRLAPVQLDAKTQKQMYETLKRKGEQIDGTPKKAKLEDDNDDGDLPDEDNNSDEHIDESIAQIVQNHGNFDENCDVSSNKDQLSSNASVQEASSKGEAAPGSAADSSEIVISFNGPMMGEHGYSAAKDATKDAEEEMDLSAVGEDYVGFALSDEESVVNKSSKPESPSLANQSGQMMSHMFTWLQRYEDRQERREHDMFNRMERMQSETLDVMKNLITIIASKKSG